MPEKPKKEKEFEEETDETGDASSWSKDQKEKNYYYDDACGYEVYNPDEDEEGEFSHE